MTLTRARLAMLFGAVLLLFLIATFPLAAALGWSGLGARGFSARTATGSIWSGSLIDAALGDAPLGNLNMRLSPLALFTGRAEFAFDPADAAAPAPRGKIAATPSGLQIKNLTANLPLGRLLPLAGEGAALALQDFDVRFNAGRCADASGAATATVPIADSILPGVGTLMFSGNVACDGDRLLLPLTGRSSAGDAGLFVRIAASGDYIYELMVTAGPAADAQLAAAGFVGEGGRRRLRGSGRL